MSSRVKEAVLQEIQAQGKITFARFMEMALFSPGEGYYTSANRPSPRTDYFTSPEAHPVFGALLALQLEQLWELLGRPHPFTVVEVGAGSGLLARDVVAACAGLTPAFFEALQYVVVERRGGRLLPSAHALGVQRVTAASLPVRDVVGCVLSNELLDAFPVHRFVVHQGRLQELYVTSDGQDALVEVPGEPSTPLLEERLQGLGIHLTEGFIGEINLSLGWWMEEVTQGLERGFVITIDYGHPAPLLYSQERSQGTLRCYYRHTLRSNPYLHVGEQDMTSHVDFSTVMAEGERRGVTTLGLTTQGAFLFSLGLGAFLRALTAADLPQHHRSADQMAMRHLARPEGLGGLGVLIQGKGIGHPPLYGLAPDNPLRHRLESAFRTLKPPLLTQDHIPLLEGAYPHLAGEVPWQEMWG